MATFTLMGGVSRLFRVGDMPAGELEITAIGEYELGNCARFELLADGDGVEFEVERVPAAGGRSEVVTLDVTSMGVADSVFVNWWLGPGFAS